MPSRRQILQLMTATLPMVGVLPASVFAKARIVNDLPKPPVAARRPHSYSRHGYTIEDPYFWLKDQGYPKVDDEDVLAYLREENAYFDAWKRPNRQLIDTLFAEMKGRVQQDDASVPQREGDWLYWWAYQPGSQYPIHYRRAVAGGEPVAILDEPREAEGKEYWRVGVMEVSPDGRLLAWSADTSGAERFTLKIRDLTTGQDIETVTAIANGAVAWTADSKAVAFGEVNESWRIDTLKLHRLGTPIESARVLYREPDIGFQAGVGTTQDRRFIVLAAGDNQTSEVRLLPADAPDGEPVLVRPRKVRHQYEVDSANGRLWIRTNEDHVNFGIKSADPAKPADWTPMVAGSDGVYIRGLTSFRRHLVVTERVAGLDQIRLRGYDGTEARVPFPEASYTVSLSNNPEFDPAAYRVTYASLVTPRTVYDVAPDSRALTSLKVQQVPSGYDPTLYQTERLMVQARDGKQIPVSVVYRRGYPKDGSGKLFLYAYGAYGHAIPPGFSTNRISLLDRGWAYAIAHIRGGDDLGYDWYLGGKAEERWNTFRDFSDVGRGLVKAGFAKPGRIAVNGGSAGGELMGVVANTDPDLWGAVIADVPFVDVLNTMQDESLPLTPGEWPEWGNPITSKAAFELLRSYSPYDNVAAKNYPPLLITGGLNDPRVTYWEPAKWAAALRHAKTDENLLLLKINMGAGHGGKSGRFDYLEEVAEAYAFAITQVDEAEAAGRRA